MARWYEPSAEQEAAWAAWVAGRPESVRSVAASFPPWELYRLKDSGQRVTPYSFHEPEGDCGVTLTVAVSGQFNLVAFERRVFGIAPEDLEPCEPPGPDEPVGVVATEPEEVAAVIDALRIKTAHERN